MRVERGLPSGIFFRCHINSNLSGESTVMRKGYRRFSYNIGSVAIAGFDGVCYFAAFYYISAGLESDVQLMQHKQQENNGL